MRRLEPVVQLQAALPMHAGFNMGTRGGSPVIATVMRSRLSIEKSRDLSRTARGNIDTAAARVENSRNLLQGIWLRRETWRGRLHGRHLAHSSDVSKTWGAKCRLCRLPIEPRDVIVEFDEGPVIHVRCWRVENPYSPNGQPTASPARDSSESTAPRMRKSAARSDAA